jgi:hypothetical protein
MTVLEPNQELPPPPPQIATPKTGTTRSQMLTALLVLVLALALIVVVLLTSPFWAPDAARVLPWAPPPLTAAKPDDAAVRRLQARLDADETELKQQGARLSGLDEAEGAIKDQERRLARLETRAVEPSVLPQVPAAVMEQASESDAAIKTLEAQIDRLTANNSATSDRLAKLEANIKTAVAANSAHRARLIAFANLRIAAGGAAPFTAELAAAQALAGDDAATKDALASLSDSAKAGLPTTAALAERFDRNVAPAILRSPQYDANASWWQQMRSRIERLVVIRRIGPGGSPPSDAAEAAVTKADAALRVGDLGAAVTALDVLPVNAAKAAAPWLARAKQRLTAETTLAMLWRDEVARSSAPESGKNQ